MFHQSIGSPATWFSYKCVYFFDVLSHVVDFYIWLSFGTLSSHMCIRQFVGADLKSDSLVSQKVLPPEAVQIKANDRIDTSDCDW